MTEVAAPPQETPPVLEIPPQPAKRRRRRTAAEIASQSGESMPGGLSDGKTRISGDLKTIQEGINALFSSIGTTVYTFNQFDGTVCLTKFPALSDGILDIAKQNKRVREMLLSFVADTAYARLLMVSMTIVLPILANHRVAPGIFLYMAGDEAIAVKRAELERAEHENSPNGVNPAP